MGFLLDRPGRVWGVLAHVNAGVASIAVGELLSFQLLILLQLNISVSQ